MLKNATLRVARPSGDLNALAGYYRGVLDCAELDRFEAHDGFDGIMPGLPGTLYHLEFTCASEPAISGVPSPDNLLVFYLPNHGDRRDTVARMKRAGYQPVKSFNPYWNRCRGTFEDPDGCRVVLQNDAWKR